MTACDVPVFKEAYASFFVILKSTSSEVAFGTTLSFSGLVSDVVCSLDSDILHLCLQPRYVYPKKKNTMEARVDRDIEGITVCVTTLSTGFSLLTVEHKIDYCEVLLS